MLWKIKFSFWNKILLLKYFLIGFKSFNSFTYSLSKFVELATIIF